MFLKVVPDIAICPAFLCIIATPSSHARRFLSCNHATVLLDCAMLETISSLSGVLVLSYLFQSFSIPRLDTSCKLSNSRALEYALVACPAAKIFNASPSLSSRDQGTAVPIQSTISLLTAPDRLAKPSSLSILIIGLHLPLLSSSCDNDFCPNALSLVRCAYF